MIKTLMGSALAATFVLASPAAACTNCGIKFNGADRSGLERPIAALVAQQARPAAKCAGCGIKFNGPARSGIKADGFTVTNLTLPGGKTVGVR